MNLLTNLGPLLRRVSWIGLGVTAVAVLGLSVYLAISAQRSDPSPEVKVALARVRPGAASRRPPSPTARPVTPEREPVALPEPPAPKAAPGDGGVQPPALKPLGPTGLRPPMPVVSDPPKGPPPGATGALGKEDLEKRRAERRERQSDRLRTRVKTLEERIETYKKDGSRTSTQVERMQQSLDRLKERLKRMEEEEKAGGAAP